MMSARRLASDMRDALAKGYVKRAPSFNSVLHYSQMESLKRSNVETVFSMIKSKFGERLRSKTTTAQVNEALCKVLCHNLCVVIQSIYELNITPEFMSEAT